MDEVDDAEKKMTGVSFQLARALRMGAGHGQEQASGRHADGEGASAKPEPKESAETR